VTIRNVEDKSDSGRRFRRRLSVGAAPDKIACANRRLVV